MSVNTEPGSRTGRTPTTSAPDTTVPDRPGAVGSGGDGGLGSDRWDRYELGFATIWLLFLALPLASVWSDDHALGAKIAASGIIGVFAVVYVYGFYKDNQYLRAQAPSSRRTRWASLVLVTMGVLIGLFALVEGWGALGMVTFVAAFANFTLPLRWSVNVSVGIVVAVLGSLLATGAFDPYWPFLIIIIPVAAGTLGARVFEERKAEADTLRTEMRLADDRSRVARDVHDVLGHSLTVISLKTELCRRLLATSTSAAAHGTAPLLGPADANSSAEVLGPAEVLGSAAGDGTDQGLRPAPAADGVFLSAEAFDRCREELDEIRKISVQALTEVRATVAGLQSAPLGQELRTARRVLADSGIAAEIVGTADLLPASRQGVLGWVLREAVTNVIRHANASRCTITLTELGLTVTDNGVGMAAGEGASTGTGLVGARKRLSEHGGQLTVASPSRPVDSVDGAGSGTGGRRAPRGGGPGGGNGAAGSGPGTTLHASWPHR